MRRRITRVAVIAVCFLCLRQSTLFAEGEAQDAMAKLNSVRGEIKAVKDSHDADVQQVNREIDGKIEAARKEFHKARDRFVAEKKDRLDVLKSAYDEKIKPLKAEEKRLIEIVVPGQSNFAKTRKK